jgi:small acid-soluble spore protein D (minor alpha/beta-type SASP)
MLIPNFCFMICRHGEKIKLNGPLNTNGLILKFLKEDAPMAGSRNKLLIPGIEQYLDSIKYEIAEEFGVQLGSNTASRSNGSVGGEITKRLVKHAQSELAGSQNQES